jgi:tRNA pseudouridine55 synthase
MAALTGAREQIPPAFSAKHILGDRAYRRARRGQAVVLPSCPVEIHRFTLVERHGPDVHFEADVSSGTYVRSLARELGDLLGCGAHLAALRRLAAGPFRVEEATALDAGPAELRAALRPAREAVRHLPLVTVGADGRVRLKHGRSVPAPDDLGPGPVALVSEMNGELLAVGEASHGEARPRVVLQG